MRSLSKSLRHGRQRTLRVRNRVYHALRMSSPAERRTIIILGCQRSGTTLMLDLFAEDRRTMIYPEFSALSGGAEDRGLRLRKLPEVRAQIERVRAPITVLKPLVESQHAHSLLEGLPDARVVWMFRGFESVAVSNINYFGTENGARDLRLLLTNDPPNWRGEFVPDSTRAVLADHYSADMNPYDAAALFWWARNRLFFDLGLDEHPDVHLCEYEALVAAPRRVMNSIYDFCDVDRPARDTTTRIHSEARDRGASSAITSEVEAVCEELQAKLVDYSSTPRTAVIE